MDWAFLSPMVIVGAALVYIALERRFPYDEGQKFFRDGFWLDLVWYTLIQSYVLGLLISFVIRALDDTTGFSRWHLVTGWPLWAQVLFFFVTHDLYIYAFHRLQHRNPYLWRVHEAHHSVKDVDWLAGSRSHSLEILINQTIEFAPIVLLGGAPEVALIKGVLDAAWGMYIHSNIDVRSGWLQFVINGPEMHRWHHAREIGMKSNGEPDFGEKLGVNFATKLAIWDWLFQTAYLPKGQKPTVYGLRDPNYPRGYFTQHLYAFRPLRKNGSARSHSVNAIESGSPGTDDLTWGASSLGNTPLGESQRSS